MEHMKKFLEKGQISQQDYNNAIGIPNSNSEPGPILHPITGEQNVIQRVIANQNTGRPDLNQQFDNEAPSQTPNNDQEGGDDGNSNKEYRDDARNKFHC